MKIFKIKGPEVMKDCISSQHYFAGYDFLVKFYQEGSQDLVFLVNTVNKIKDEAFFSVKKEEYPEVYNLVSEMLQNIENNKYLDLGNGKKIIKEEYSSLFEKGYFSWQSDSPETCSDFSTSAYNYFSIIPADNEYIFVFTNNVNRISFSIETNTDRSRYGEFRFNVWDLFNGLNSVCKEISEDEFKKVREEIGENVNTKKLLLISNKYSEEARKKIRKKEAQIFRRCALRDLFNLGNFGFQLNSTNVNIKGLDTHPKEFKYKKYMDEEAAKRLYKKRNEVKID